MWNGVRLPVPNYKGEHIGAVSIATRNGRWR